MSRATSTVVIPVWNGAHFIADAVESVRNQTRPVDQIIVVDDGSTDDTPDIVQAWPDVDYVAQESAGPAAARNAGLGRATGDYVAMLDADDVWPVGRQEFMARVLDDEPDISVVIPRQRLLVEPGCTLPAWVPSSPDPEAIEPAELPRPTCSVLVRRSVFEQIGGYDESMRHGEDSDWLLRATDAGFRLEMLDEVGLVRRIHGTNLTGDAVAQHQAMFEVLRRRMVRRRPEIPEGTT